MADDNNSEAQLNWKKLPKAKRGKLITDLSARLRGCHKTKSYQVFGTWYTLRTLDPGDEGWIARFALGMEPLTYGQSRRGPAVAAALVAMGETEHDQTSMEALFEVPDDMPEDTLAVIKADKVFERDWRRGEVLRWLTEPEGHERLIAEVYARYLELEKERNEALVALDPLSKKTPIGESSTTSSPVKESSSVTLQ